MKQGEVAGPMGCHVPQYQEEPLHDIQLYKVGYILIQAKKTNMCCIVQLSLTGRRGHREVNPICARHQVRLWPAWKLRPWVRGGEGVAHVRIRRLHPPGVGECVRQGHRVPSRRLLHRGTVTILFTVHLRNFHFVPPKWNHSFLFQDFEEKVENATQYHQKVFVCSSEDPYSEGSLR